MCYRHRMRARDTSERAAAVQNQIHDQLGPSGRFKLAMQMSQLAREFAKSGVRQTHPELSDDELVRELVKIFYGR